ncbi:Anaerobic ribonucleoside-triphosphate reductase [Escherichia coli]|uniref:Anaerobic ribonucleoside-triphosphate reductase n=1 Tax=Escherichia coli TaxID=562 RepID=A0A376U1M5_ECOLX|nr:Anaerobic ribonucleoside-triphosphate reductase [Escherichia coli]
MTPHVMKRDGCKVPFKSERIKEAILRAAKAAEVDDADYCATVAAVVSEQMQGRNQVDINEIQTAVEKPADVGSIQTTGSCLHRVPSRSRH